jgi:hypothetical protein
MANPSWTLDPTWETIASFFILFLVSLQNAPHFSAVEGRPFLMNHQSPFKFISFNQKFLDSIASSSHFDYSKKGTSWCRFPYTLIFSFFNLWRVQIFAPFQCNTSKRKLIQ